MLQNHTVCRKETKIGLLTINLLIQIALSQCILWHFSSTFGSFQYAESTGSTGSASGHGMAASQQACDLDLNTFLEGTNIRFQRVWELNSETRNVSVYGPQNKSLLQSRRAKIAKYVAASAEVCISFTFFFLFSMLQKYKGMVLC